MIVNAEGSSAIILGTKRSGSNFTHDVLSYAYKSAVQEPLGLHNEAMSFARNPLDPWRYSSAQHVSSEYGHAGLKDDPYGSLLTRNFVTWLKEGSKLIKETDFLYLSWLYASVPLRTVLLERDPRDCIASFKRGNLYNKWGYTEKMEQFVATIRETPELNALYGDVGVLDNLIKQPKHRQLALYYAIATQEIVRNTSNIDKINVDYKEMTERPFEMFRDICSFLGLSWDGGIQKVVTEHTTATKGERTHDTFRNKTDIHSYRDTLTAIEIADIGSIFEEFGIRLEKSSLCAFSPLVTWGNESKSREQYKIKQRQRDEVIEEIQRQAIEIGIDKTSSLRVGKYLVSNEQYAQFLLWLQQNSIPIAVNGKPLFYNDRPQSRIHITEDGIYIDKKFTNHPVVFVNWIAAAIFCKYINGRLPTSAEWDAIADSSSTVIGETNQQTYGYGDTLPVDFSPPDSRGIYDLIGNTGVWVDSIMGKANLEA